jgi:DNA-binding NarL/FixJ family response regulator
MISRSPLGMRRTIRVALIERVPLIVNALRHVLGRDGSIDVVADFAEATDPGLAEVRPDIVLIDVDELSVPLEEAFGACERAVPQSRIAALSAQNRPRAMQRVLAANADAYITKDTSPAMLVEILHSVAAGDSYADPRIAGQLLRRRVTRSQDIYDLSGRETEIVRLIAEGLSNRDIGTRLALSEKTVKNHVSHILAKLKVSARSGVAVYAVRKGLVN